MTTPFEIAANSLGFPHQDYIILGSGQSPGVCTVDVSRPQGWDERKGTALTGATVVPTGAPLARPIVRIKLWTGFQYAQWLTFSATYLARAAVVVPGTITTKALSIVHPILNDPPFLITEVVVEDVKAIPQTEEGIWEYEIHFLEYRKPIPALAKAAAVIPPAAKPVPTAQDRAIAANTALIASLTSVAPTPSTFLNGLPVTPAPPGPK